MPKFEIGTVIFTVRLEFIMYAYTFTKYIGSLE